MLKSVYALLSSPMTAAAQDTWGMVGVGTLSPLAQTVFVVLILATLIVIAIPNADLSVKPRHPIGWVALVLGLLSLVFQAVSIALLATATTFFGALGFHVTPVALLTDIGPRAVPGLLAALLVISAGFKQIRGSSNVRVWAIMASIVVLVATFVSFNLEH